MTAKFGLTAVVALAIGVMVAPIAQASEFTAGTSPVFIQGSNTVGTEKISTEAGNVLCDSSFQGTATLPSSEIRLHPTYSNCEAFGFLKATLNTEECDYRFNLGPKIASDLYESAFDVTCPTGQSIKIVASTCAAEIKSQNNLLSWDVTDDTVASPKDITIKADAWPIAYTVTKDGFLCPFNGTGNKTSAVYYSVDPMTLSGRNSFYHEEKVDIAASGE